MRWSFIMCVLWISPVYADDAYQKAVDSVVGVVATSGEEVHSGTGVVLYAKEIVSNGRTQKVCLVATACHVVKKGAIEVIFPVRDANGAIIGNPDHYAGRGQSAEIIGTDSKRDLALVVAIGPESVKPIGLSRGASPGDQIFTIGAAGAGALWHYASGNVRQLYDGRFKTRTNEVQGRIIEMTIPINHGDSGGPILNKDNGELVGINLATMPTSNQLHCGICVSEVRTFALEALTALAERASKAEGKR